MTRKPAKSVSRMAVAHRSASTPVSSASVDAGALVAADRARPGADETARTRFLGEAQGALNPRRERVGHERRRVGGRRGGRLDPCAKRRNPSRVAGPLRGGGADERLADDVVRLDLAPKRRLATSAISTF